MAMLTISPTCSSPSNPTLFTIQEEKGPQQALQGGHAAELTGAPPGPRHAGASSLQVALERGCP